jgi:hypothetical protein
MLNENVCLFRGVDDTSVDTVVPLGSVLAGIRDGKWKTEIEYMRKLNVDSGKKACDPIKKSLTAFTMSGIFSEKRSSDMLKNHTGLVQIDIDDCEDIEAVRGRLQADRHIAFVFLSPRGTGIKAGLRIPKNCDQAEAHNQAKAYFGINGWDSAVKDPARICFVSYDENLYVNENAEEFRPIEKKSVPKKNIGKLPYIEDDLQRRWANELFDSAYKMISESADGDKHFQRLKAGRLLGGGVAHGLFSESEVLGEMERIVSGYTRLPIEKAMKDVVDGVRQGQSEPLSPPKYIEFRAKMQQKVVSDYKNKTGQEATYQEIITDKSSVELGNLFFRVLGKMDGKLYIHPYNIGQPMHFNDFKKQDLIKFAPLHYWESVYGGENGTVSWDNAISDITHSCTDAGYYNAESVRGRGVWIDNGRTVINTGKSIICNGVEHKYQQFSDTEYIYTEGYPLKINVSKVATKEQAQKLLQIANLLPFKKDSHKHLFIGHIISSIVCGGLAWRSHLYLTAPAGSGKSWIMENIIRRILGNFAIYPQGEESTEAGIRQNLKADAVAVVHDEAEGETESGKRNVQKKLVLARQSSSESIAKIMKGTVDGVASMYTIRSSFMFISTALPKMRRADESRWTIVELKRKDPLKAMEEQRIFKALEALVREVITEEFCESIRARSIALVDVIRENASVFASVLPQYLSSQRSADQISTMLAGAYSLESDTPITAEKAELLCSGMDFEDEITLDEQSEELTCLHTIMSCVPHGLESSIGDMIVGALGDDNYSDKELRKYGIAVFDRKVFFSTSKSNTMMTRLLDGTPYKDTYIREISRITGAERHDKQVKCYGVPMRGVTVPSSVFSRAYKDSTIPSF